MLETRTAAAAVSLPRLLQEEVLILVDVSCGSKGFQPHSGSAFAKMESSHECHR